MSSDPTSTQELILAPLRLLYQQEDSENRCLIALYANNFKQRGVFLRKEADFISQRLLFHHFNFASDLLPVQLLTVELVPSTCWFSNVRDHVSKSEWDFLRRATYQKANYLCESCGGKGNKWPVECHEIWHYDEQQQIQTLKKLTALCPSCHQVKHIGLATIQGYGHQAKAHLSYVNHWSPEQTNTYLQSVWDIWEQRSCLDWSLNLSLLHSYGLNIQPKR
jgi:5-methylcytosine-specific restriction endonuclease McrA